MKRQWVIYIVVGILFGVFDFYFPNFLPKWSTRSIMLSEILGFILTFGIWLVPNVPIVLYEAKVSRSKLLPAVASALTWCISVIFYYVANIVQLALGSSSQPDLRISNYNSQYFWNNWKSILLSYVLEHVIEWVIIAVIGGLTIGFLVSFIFLFLSRNKQVIE